MLKFVVNGQQRWMAVSYDFNPPIVGSLLGHSQPSVTHRCVHLAEDPRSKAAEEIAGKISTALKGGTFA